MASVSASHSRVKLSGSVVLDLDAAGPTSYGSLTEGLDAFAWSVLDLYHAGFENNEGGFGSIEIDVAKGAITVDHNDRIVEVCNSMMEV